MGNIIGIMLGIVVGSMFGLALGKSVGLKVKRLLGKPEINLIGGNDGILEKVGVGFDDGTFDFRRIGFLLGKSENISVG